MSNNLATTKDLAAERLANSGSWRLFGKLFKYDLARLLKSLAPFYIISLSLALIARVCLGTDHLVLPTVGWWLRFFSIGAAASGLVNCIIRAWVFFTANFYKDESYLTHTLPVTRRALYLSKTLAAVANLLVAFAVVIVCVAICFYTQENWNGLVDYLGYVGMPYQMSAGELSAFALVAFFLQLTTLLSLGCTSLVLGYQHNKQRMVHTLLMGFGLYLCTVFGSAIVASLLTDGLRDGVALRFMIWVYPVYIAVFYIIGQHYFAKGVNVD